MARFDAVIGSRFEVVRIQGDERVCVCPFHADSRESPNLSVNAESGLWHCFVCQARGSLRREKNAPQANLGALQRRLHQGKDEIVRPYPESWLDRFDHPTDYWIDRGFSEQVIKLFRLGYDPVTNCPTIPLRNSRGNVMGVIRRQLPPARPKYLNPKGFKRGRDLYGAWLVRQRHYRRVAIVEGPADAIACWDANVPAVALHGSSMTVDQANLLRGLGPTTIVIMTDDDRAGDEAAHQIKSMLLGLNVMVGWYRPLWMGKDPGELDPIRRKQMFLDARRYDQIEFA